MGEWDQLLLDLVQHPERCMRSWHVGFKPPVGVCAICGGHPVVGFAPAGAQIQRAACAKCIPSDGQSTTA